ncbi:hypothetical protein GCM10009557_90460 [Virgisporangium ochraceum]
MPKFRRLIAAPVLLTLFVTLVGAPARADSPAVRFGGIDLDKATVLDLQKAFRDRKLKPRRPEGRPEE